MASVALVLGGELPHRDQLLPVPVPVAVCTGIATGVGGLAEQCLNRQVDTCFEVEHTHLPVRIFLGHAADQAVERSMGGVDYVRWQHRLGVACDQGPG